MRTAATSPTSAAAVGVVRELGSCAARACPGVAWQAAGRHGAGGWIKSGMAETEWLPTPHPPAQSLACGLATVARDAETLPVALVPEQGRHATVRCDVVEHRGRLRLAGGAHRVSAEEGAAHPAEPGIVRVEVRRAWMTARDLIAVGVRGAVAAMHGVVGTARVAALLIGGGWHLASVISAAWMVLDDSGSRGIETQPAVEAHAQVVA